MECKFFCGKNSKIFVENLKFGGKFRSGKRNLAGKDKIWFLEWRVTRGNLSILSEETTHRERRNESLKHIK
jgi:hypothetical protein